MACILRASAQMSSKGLVDPAQQEVVREERREARLAELRADLERVRQRGVTMAA
jgi:DnaJ-domain-containing protein 1